MMMKRLLAGMIAFLGLCLLLDAQTNRSLFPNSASRAGLSPVVYQPDIFRTMDSAALIHGIPALALTNPGSYSFTSAWVDASVGTVHSSPIFNAPDSSKESPGAASGSDKPIAMGTNSNVYVGGEIGFLYGRSSGGRNSMDEKSTYIIGEVGNDKVHLSVGAAYDETNFHFSRPGR